MKPPIIYEIEDERKRQDQLWGGPEHDDEHDEWDWFAYLTGQMMRLDQAILKQNAEEYRKRLVKLAALAIAAAESYDRLDFTQ